MQSAKSNEMQHLMNKIIKKNFGLKRKSGKNQLVKKIIFLLPERTVLSFLHLMMTTLCLSKKI